MQDLCSADFYRVLWTNFLAGAAIDAEFLSDQEFLVIVY
jgi:hypothetical protein